MNDAAHALAEQLQSATVQWMERAVPLFLGHGRTRPRVEVRCDLRGRSAGQLRRYADGRLVIRYNLGMALLQPQAFVRETVPHEVAHAVVWVCHGEGAKPHGTEWRAVMRHFGFDDASRCHNFATTPQPARRQRRWLYVCDCRQHELSSVRHNRARKGQTYICRSCRAALRPLRRETPTS